MFQLGTRPREPMRPWWRRFCEGGDALVEERAAARRRARWASCGQISFSAMVAVSNKNSRVGLLAMCENCFHVYHMTAVASPSHCWPKSLKASKRRPSSGSKICRHRCFPLTLDEIRQEREVLPHEVNHRFTRNRGTMCGFV